MHGIIFAELRRFAEVELGPESWSALVTEAGLPANVYQVAQQFPDSEFGALLDVIARKLGRPVATVLQDFGTFIASELLKMHAHSIRPDWRTLDVIEHTRKGRYTRSFGKGIRMHSRLKSQLGASIVANCCLSIVRGASYAPLPKASF